MSNMKTMRPRGMNSTESTPVSSPMSESYVTPSFKSKERRNLSKTIQKLVKKTQKYTKCNEFLNFKVK